MIMKHKNYGMQDIDSKKSSKSGLAGILETCIRRFRSVVHYLVILALYALGSVLMGISIVPGIYLFKFTYAMTINSPQFVHYAFIGISLAAGYFLYGITLILAVLPFANFIFRLKLKPWRGIYYSLEALPWYVHNSLTYIARYTFLFLATPTPLNIQFYRMMGMKIGRGVQINTTNISDPSLITLEDKVTLGGSSTVIAHYGQSGFLITSPVRIRKRAVIGLKVTIMGGVDIGEGAKVLANSFVLPKTKIPAGEVWGGIPAVCLRKADENPDNRIPEKVRGL